MQNEGKVERKSCKVKVKIKNGERDMINLKKTANTPYKINYKTL